MTLPGKQEHKEAKAFLATVLVMVLLPALPLLLTSILLLTLSPTRLTEDTAGWIAPLPLSPNKDKDAFGVAKLHCRDQ